MNKEIFPEIVFRKEFSGFEKDPFVRAIRFIQGKDDDFKKKYNSISASNLLKYRDFRKICDTLNADGITHFIPVKGMFVFNTIFSEYQGLRAMSDIDLLFAPEEYKKLKDFFVKHPEFPAAHGEHSFLEHSREAFCVISATALGLHQNRHFGLRWRLRDAVAHTARGSGSLCLDDHYRICRYGGHLTNDPRPHFHQPGDLCGLYHRRLWRLSFGFVRPLSAFRHHGVFHSQTLHEQEEQHFNEQYLKGIASQTNCWYLLFGNTSAVRARNSKSA